MNIRSSTKTQSKSYNKWDLRFFSPYVRLLVDHDREGSSFYRFMQETPRTHLLLPFNQKPRLKPDQTLQHLNHFYRTKSVCGIRRWTAPPSSLLVPLNCCWFGNVVVEGIKLFSWFQLWTSNHHSLQGRTCKFYHIVHMGGQRGL